MGEARRKQRLITKEGTPLFAAHLPARVAISRPSARLVTTQRLEAAMAADIARAAATDKPMLCLNPKCDTELHALPAVRIFFKTSDDPKVLACARALLEEGAHRDSELTVWWAQFPPIPTTRSKTTTIGAAE